MTGSSSNSSPETRARVEKLVKGGLGLVRHQGRVILLPGVLAGEQALFRPPPAAEKKPVGELLEIIDPSPRRVKAPCPWYGDCGGCNLQHASYSEQLDIKKGILLDCLERIGRLADFPAVKLHPAPEPWHYRSRLNYSLSRGRPGFKRRGSHEFLAVSACPLAPPAMNSFLDEQLPGLRQVAGGHLALLSNGRETAGLLSPAGAQSRLLGSLQHIEFIIDSKSFSCGPQDFMQANLGLLSLFWSLLEQGLAGLEINSAADLFSGCGFLSLPLAGLAGRVTAVELSPRQNRTAQANARANGLNNVDFQAADLYRQAPPAADVYLLDPPRGGLSRRLIKDVCNHKPLALVCFSCDPATFARDLAIFREHGYRPQNIDLLDAFPQSDHFEIFSVLKKN